MKAVNSSVERPFRSAFTLVELLVVIGIIALLVSILLPALNNARQSAAATKGLSGLRQIGMGLQMYKNENRGFYPVHSSPSSAIPRTRWADAIFTYMKNTEVYMSPLMDEQERQRMNKPFAHTVDQTTGAAIPGQTVYFGGYGYNYHYLGNARTPGGVLPYHANDSRISAHAQTIAVADTHGSKNGGDTWTSEGVYSLDPPLSSITLGSKGSRRSSPDPLAGNNYGYTGGADGDPKHRATPAERNRGMVNVLFCDGHAVPMKLREMDDFNNDGQPDNGWWNGKANSLVR